MDNFIISKSKNIAKVQSWFEKLADPEAVTEEDLEKISESSTENPTEKEIKSQKNEKKKTEKKDEEKATLI